MSKLGALVIFVPVALLAALGTMIWNGPALNNPFGSQPEAVKSPGPAPTATPSPRPTIIAITTRFQPFDTGDTGGTSDAGPVFEAVDPVDSVDAVPKIANPGGSPDPSQIPAAIPIPTEPAITPQPTAPPPTAAPPPSTLTAPEIFARLDRGEITMAEAKSLLQGQGSSSEIPPPANTTPAPTAGIAPTATPVPFSEPDPAVVSAHLQRGSPEWAQELARRIHLLVNIQREKAQIPGLTVDASLADIARGHSQDMACGNYLAHQNLVGQSPSDRARESGYRCFKNQGGYYAEGIGENIFKGWLYSSISLVEGSPANRNYRSLDQLAQVVVDSWMNSPGHRTNIMKSSYSTEGIGVAITATEQVYITQNFC